MAKDEKSYEKARDLTEKALDSYVESDDARGDELVEQAKAVNEKAVRDVQDELEEDAGAEHDPAKLQKSGDSR
ncbi:MAG: hypothetical protein U1E70_29785 [Acetobacteraceae bacterium]|nr:hypothetical protein [Pseudomonadota bacterium]